MNCRTCTRTNLRREHFTIERDGKLLLTAQCRHCLAAADIAHNREQRERKCQKKSPVGIAPLR